MIGILPIVDLKGEAAATLEWRGSMRAGKGSWTWYRDKQTQKKIDGAISINQGLKEQLFADMIRDADYVRGWQGFAGWFQALTIALPAFGLKVDGSKIIWPIEVAAGAE